MLAIADRIAYINEQQLNAGNHRVDSLLSEFQSRMAIILLATLLLGLAMAAIQHSEDSEIGSPSARLSIRRLSKREGNSRISPPGLCTRKRTSGAALSRELHDEVGQALSAVLVELRNLSAEAAVQTDDQSRDHVETVKSLVENSVRVVRNMALLLRPSMLDDLGLVPALQWQAREVSKRTSMDVSVATELAADDLSDEYKTCIYRVVQEALHNCSRHARATKVRIRVQQESNRLSLSIQDDGQGFDVGQTKGLGLLGIEERVAMLGGKCEIHSAPGSGTIVAIELPFNNQRREPRRAWK